MSTPVYSTDLNNNLVGVNSDITLLTLTAAGLGTVNSPDTINNSNRGMKLVINTTAMTGTVPTLTINIQGKDIASGVYYTILSSVAIATTGAVVMDLYPGIVAAANVALGLALPRTFRVQAVIGGTTPAVTATIGASLLD